MADPKSIQITLDDYEARLVIEDRSGIKTSKIVNPDDIASALVQNAKLTTGILPRNTKLYTRSGDFTLVVIEDPPRRQQRVTYRADGQRDGNVYHINTPRMLFAFIISAHNTGKSVVSSSYAYAITNPLMSLQDQLLMCPFANVHDNNNAICWGNNYLNPFESLVYLERIMDLFWEAEFNNHLDNGRSYNALTVNVTGQPMVLTRTPDLFKHLDRKDEPFPDHILKGVGEFKSILSRELRI